MKSRKYARFMSADAIKELDGGRWDEQIKLAPGFEEHLKSEFEKSGPVSVVKIDAYLNVVSGPPAAEPKTEKKHALTTDAFEYLRTKADNRFPYRMYTNVNLTTVVAALNIMAMKKGKEVEPLTLDEVKRLVHNDGEELETCPADGKLHLKVASVQLWVPNLEDADVRMDVMSKGVEYLGEVDENISKTYGRLAPFVKTFEHDGRIYPIVAGSIVPIPDDDGGWEKPSFCGPFFWHNHELGKIYPNNSSCVVKAAQGAEKQGWGKARSFSSDSADLVIGRRTANHQKSENIRANREQANAKREANLNALFEGRGSFRTRRDRR